MLVGNERKGLEQGPKTTAEKVNVPTKTTPYSEDAHVTANKRVINTATLVKTEEERACPYCGHALLDPEPARLDEIPGQETAKRAIEVACAGGHSIAFIGDDTETAWQLAQWALKHGAKRAYLEPVLLADITVEVAPPYADHSRPEPDENILQRIGEKTKEVSFELKGHVKDLMELAQRRFRLTPNQQKRLVRVAKTIAALDRYATVRPEHVAESIQYRPMFAQGGRDAA